MTQEFDLYLDESGSFIETAKVRKAQGFASQLVGILTPQEQLTAVKAESILETCYKSAGYNQLGKEVHGTKLSSGEGYDRLISTLVEKLEEKGWQPVRLVNKEAIDYGDRINNYVNMVAELALRIFQQKSLQTSTKIILNIKYAIVYLGDDQKGNPIFIEPEEYKNQLEYHLAFTAVRQGLADKYTRWKIGKCQFGSAKKERELQLCDLLSNASHDNYIKCGETTKIVLQNAFKPYDYSMIAYLALERCDLLIQNGSLGLAIRTLAERLNQEDKGENLQEGALERLELIIDQLVNRTATERNNQLTLLIDWLEQIINLQRCLVLGSQLVEWLQIKIYQPLVTELKKKTDKPLGSEGTYSNKTNTLDWFNYALHFWALTAYNHQGNLIAARQEANQLDNLIPTLAGQWEYVTLLMKGLVAEGVHRTDCLEYNETATKMELVANYYREVSSLFTVAFPDVFPEQIRSQLRGEALGTWLQAEIYAAATESNRLNKARELSDICIAEFTTPGDKAIQYQYRCHLETLAGDFKQAKEYLVKSFGIEDNSHSAISQHIKTLEGFAQGFALLHWLRLGIIAYLDNNAEWSEFIQAFKKEKFQYNSWCQGQQWDSYPVHGILRRVALIEAIEGKFNIAALGSLKNLAPIAKEELVSGLIQCAAYAEVGGFWWETNNKMARQILDSEKSDRLGLKQLLETLTSKSSDLFPQVEQLTKFWLTIINDILNNKIENTKVKSKLLELGRQISY